MCRRQNGGRRNELSCGTMRILSLCGHEEHWADKRELRSLYTASVGQPKLVDVPALADVELAVFEEGKAAQITPCARVKRPRPWPAA